MPTKPAKKPASPAKRPPAKPAARPSRPKTPPAPPPVPTKRRPKVKPSRQLTVASEVLPEPARTGKAPPGRVNQWPVRGAPGVESLFGWDAENVAAALREHARGSFARSGLLLDDLTANPIIGHCLEVRQEAWRTLPRVFEKGRGEHADRCLAFWREVFPDILPDATLDDWTRHFLFMGDSLSGMDWEERRDGRDRWWLPLIKPWHPSQTYRQYRPGDGERTPDGQVLVAITREQGPVVVEPGWGRWVHIARGTLSPWLNGLIRALGEPYLGDTYTLRDNLALQERFGQGILKLIHPVEWNDQQVESGVWSVRASGRGGVISCPTTADGKRKVDVESVKADAVGAQVFDLTERRLMRRFLITLLGQDMTTVGQTGGFAQAAVHSQVLWHKRERDAASFGDARLSVDVDPMSGKLRRRWVPYSGPIRTQIARWVALFNFGSFEAAPFTYWDATPPVEDLDKRKGEADLLTQRASALKALVDALPAIMKQFPDADPAYLLEQLGIRVRRPEEPEAA